MALDPNLGFTIPVPGNTGVVQQINDALAAISVYVHPWTGTQTAPAVPAARVYNTAVQSLANDTNVAITFNSERYDTDTIHSTSSNTDRLTCKTAGLYAITFQVGFASNATGERRASIELNGTTLIASTLIAAVPGNVTRLTLTTNYFLAVNDYVRGIALQNSGGSLNTEQGGNFTPEFSCARIG